MEGFLRSDGSSFGRRPAILLASSTLILFARNSAAFLSGPTLILPFRPCRTYQTPVSGRIQARAMFHLPRVHPARIPGRSLGSVIPDLEAVKAIQMAILIWMAERV